MVGVLDFLAEHPEEAFNLTELCRRLDMNKATAHSLLGELAEAGYLVRDPVDKTYGLGPRLLAVGLAAGRNERALLNRARRHLRRLATELDVRCVASVLRGDELVILEVAGRDRPFRPSIQPGHRVPCVPPIGAVFVAWSSEPEVERWLDRAGDTSPEHRAAYLDALATVRGRGAAVALEGSAQQKLERSMVTDEARPVADAVRDLDHEDYLLVDLEPRESYRLSHLAAPVFGPDGQVVLAITVYDLPVISSATDVEAWVTRLRAATDALTGSIGGREAAR